MNQHKKTLLVFWGIIWEWIIIPTLVVYLALFLNRRLPYFLPFRKFDVLFAVAFLAIGLFWTLSSCLHLRFKGWGTIIPFCDPPCRLVTEGIYGYCRNPMYLGYLMLFLGLAIITSSFFILILSTTGTGLFLFLYIRLHEEKILALRFGKEYLKYRSQTPFLMPLRLVPRKAEPLRLFVSLHLIFLILFFSFGITEAFSLFNFKKDPTLQAEQQLRALPDLPAIGKKDRIMILAPHPDDEILGTGGVIQKAREAGVPVKIVFLTNGDHDLVTFKIDTGRILLTPKQYIAMAEKRQQESLSAAVFLGLKKKDLLFLGYPDFGTLKIWNGYWQNAPAFRNGLTRAKAVPYPNSPSFQKPYKGENILSDLTTVLEEYRPTKIFATIPADANGDHQAAYGFLSAAILNAGEKITAPSVFFYLVHLGAWPKPYHYHPEFPLLPPKRLKNSEFQWFKLALTPEETAKKYQATLFFKSVLKGRAYLWTAFAKQNELFAVMPELRMKTIPRIADPDWSKALKMENVGANETDAQPELEANLRGVSYLMSNDYLLVKIFLKKSFEVKTGISLYLFGFRRDVPFGAMPKIRLTASTLATMFAYDGTQKIGTLPATLSGDGTELLVEVPLSLLKQPESIFTSLRMHRGDLPLDSTAWHLLLL
ncbi:MAG: PIG-L family deacetylase [Candidatus Ratteibacteria bacterium]|jgi:LmbE family N-acetylglucosaminyl deacetylase/protein-S-isoprenylcysteine O-methyltransferase Ste14